MASYHLSVKVGARGKAAPHAEYISRSGKYSAHSKKKYEDIDCTEFGNLPSWANCPTAFWSAADELERENGYTYREFEFALPRELSVEQRRQLVRDFVQQEIGDKHAYQWAIHTPPSSLEGGEQPHCHLMFSERTHDGIERDPSQYFRRANKKNPQKGGCAKSTQFTGGKTKKDAAQAIDSLRKRWAELQNTHLELLGHVGRVDHRSFKARGIDMSAEKRVGPQKRLSNTERRGLCEARQARREYLRAASAATSMTDKIKEQKIKPTLNYIENNSAQADFAQKSVENNYSHIKIMYSATTPAASQPEALRQQLLDMQGRAQELIDKPEPKAANTLAQDLQKIAWQIESEEKQSEAESAPCNFDLIKGLAEGVRLMVNSVLRLFSAKEIDPFFPSENKKGGTTTERVSVSVQGRSVFQVEEDIEASKKTFTELRSRLNRAGSRKPRTPREIAYHLFDEALAADPTNKKLGAQWEALSNKFEVALDHEKRLKEKIEESNPLTRKLLKLDEKLDAAGKAATIIAWQRQAIEAKQTENKISLGQEKGPQIMEEAERIAALEAEPEKLKRELRDRINAELKKIEALRHEREKAEQRQAELLEQEPEVRHVNRNDLGRPT